MTTAVAVLDQSQYVRINNGGVALLLQSHRDSVRVVFGYDQPPVDATAFHEIGSTNDNKVFEIGFTPVPVWALATTDHCKLTITNLGVPEVKPGQGISTDAWGRSKVVSDRSLVSGMFTNSIIPSNVFKESINGVEQSSFVNATSDSGLLNLEAGVTLDDDTVLDTFRSPRYEANRGHLYSSSILLPSPTALGQRNFGMFTEENGAFFRLKSDGNLYACRRTTNNGGPTTSTVEELIDTSILASTFDLSKGNIYDIQMQWRGVGNLKFYIGDPVLGYSIVVHQMKILGTLTELSIANPALPIAYQCINEGDNVVIQSGCVDISSEGGTDENHVYGSIPVPTQSGDINFSGFDVPILVVRNKKTLNGLRNMRDVQALFLTAYSDARSFVKVWVTRDETAITLNDQTWTDYGDGNLEYIHYDTPNVASPITFDTTKARQTFGTSFAAFDPYGTSAQFEGKTEIHQSPGDIFIFTLSRTSGGNSNGGVTYEFGDEV